MIEIIDIFDRNFEKKPTALALGLFDGVHIGHETLLRETVKVATAKGLLPAVFTFHSTNYKPAATLFTREATYRQMEELGIKRIFEADFSKIANLSPEAFIERVLRDVCSASAVFCGENFRFGQGAKGNADLLCQLFSKGEEKVFVVSPVKIEGQVVSSSLVREAVTEGDMEKAALYLGFPYQMEGEIKHGKALGKKMQFPTINLEIPSGFAIPKRGVYISLAKIGEQLYPAITNIGVRPTVENTEKDNCETHLIDAAGDFYGQAAAVSLLAFLREERQFSDAKELFAQIGQDCDRAREWFARHKDFKKFS